MNQQNIKSPLWHALLMCTALVSHAQASHAERADRDKPMHLEADQVSVDDAKQISTFEGNVQFIQGTMSIRGNRIIVTQSKDGFMHGTVTGQPASFRQKREGSDEYVEGYGERIEYDSKSETLDLFGQARMKMRQDEVSGEHITYNSRTEIFQVHGASGGQMNASGKPVDMQNKGRVRAVIQPKNRNAANPVEEPLSIRSEDTPTQPENHQ